MSSEVADVVGVVLAAGRGSRMSPITDRVPKPLLTVNNEPLLELALRRVSSVVGDIAVNAHHLADQIAEAALAFSGSVHVSFERERLLGTAGALRQLRSWIDGRPVLVANSDVWLSDPIDGFLDGWDGNRPRLLVQDMGRPADFGRLRYLGVSTLPARTAAALEVLAGWAVRRRLARGLRCGAAGIRHGDRAIVRLRHPSRVPDRQSGRGWRRLGGGAGCRGARNGRSVRGAGRGDRRARRTSRVRDPRPVRQHRERGPRRGSDDPNA